MLLTECQPCVIGALIHPLAGMGKRLGDNADGLFNGGKGLAGRQGLWVTHDNVVMVLETSYMCEKLILHTYKTLNIRTCQSRGIETFFPDMSLI